MGEKTLGIGYFVDPSGETVQLPADQAPQALQLGYLPASPEQIEDFQKIEKYSTVGQQAKTFGEGLGQSLTFGLSTAAERGLGVNPEDIQAREEINPNAHLAGSLTGVAIPLVLSGGASGVVEGGAAAAGEGAEVASGLLGTAKAAARTASRYSAPSLIAKAGEAAAEGVEHLLPEAETALGRVATKAALGAASAGAEGALYGAGHVVHEAALGDPNLTATSALEEVGLSALLGGGVGATGGILSGLTREAAAGSLGKKLEEWAHNFEGNRNLKSAGGVQSDLAREAKKIGLDGVNQLGREGGDLGLVGAFSTPAQTLERSEALMESSGKKIGDILDTADASGWAKPRPIEPILSRVRSEVLNPLAENPLEAPTARRLEEIMQAEEQRFSSTVGTAENDITFRDLHQLRKELSDKIYGLRGTLDPEANALRSSLHDFRSIVSDEINKGLESADLPSASLKAWKEANREYQVASTFAKFAEKGVQRQIGNNLVPLTSLVSGGAGLIAGGPIGGTALGIGGYLAKRYGSGVLAAGARQLRHLIDEGAAESVVNKTADLIAKERAAASNTAADAVAMHSSAMARAFDKAAEHLEPLVAPAKDATRHVLHENVEEKLAHQAEHQIEGAASGEHEAVAALSHLEAANQRMTKIVDDLAHAVATGKVSEHEAARAFAKSTDEFEKQMEEVRHLANNAEAASQKISDQTADVHEHAPAVAQALAVNASRAIAHLNQSFPAQPKPGPLAPKMVPSAQDLWRYNKTREALEKPTSILKHAAAGTLTPIQVNALRAAYPERLQQMQTAVLEKIAEHKGTVPYTQRLMLPILFGQDMDGSASAAAIMNAQTVYRMPSNKSGEDATGPGALKSTQTGLGKLKLSHQSMTPGQAAEGRRRGEE